MAIVNTGGKYVIFGDDLKTYDSLPAGTYKTGFSPMSGFWLEKTDDFKNTEKVYGKSERYRDIVFERFNSLDRSLGVMLSGDKGIGKSLFLRLIGEQAVQEGLPVIIVDDNYDGIKDFLESIRDKAVIVFDEFEKVFPDGHTENTSQNDLLGLFDGISQRKHLYVVTVNELHNVSDYFLNRPGRFHFHFRFEALTVSLVREYLKDKAPDASKEDIQGVEQLASLLSLNYDLLRAIAIELNAGLHFKEVLEVLNILKTGDMEKPFKVSLKLKGDNVVTLNKRLDIMQANRLDTGSWDSDNLDMAIAWDAKDLKYRDNGDILITKLEYSRDNGNPTHLLAQYGLEEDFENVVEKVVLTPILKDRYKF